MFKKQKRNLHRKQQLVQRKETILMNNKLTVKERKSMFRRWIFSAGLGYNYESQQAPSVAFSMRKALRKIYSDDDEYIAAMDNHYNYFNATPQMANVILGATLAMEEEDGIGAKDAVQSLKTSLMGPLSGVGDSVFWILIPTIMGSIAGYMALQKNAIGAILWMIMYVAFYWLKMWLCNLGYESGTKLITTLGEKINIFTDAISIMGLMVVGSLIPTVVKVYTPLKFATGKVSLSLQKGVFDKIMPGLLPVALAFLVYWLLGKKSWTPTRIIILIIAICLIGAATGILGIAK
jgi:PTS system mannose-specific IID component